MVKKDPGARMRLCAPCLFGLEGPLGNELRHMGMDSVAPENGRVLFETDAAGLARANIRSRFAERILLELGAFPARSFDELFEGVRAIPLEDWLPRDAAFPVKGWSLESQLHSVPDCQSIIKKAAAVRLGAAYGLSHMPETGVLYQMQFSIMKDEVRIYLDTSGTGLHKRGYRPAQVAAPLRETLAAAMVDIAGYRGRGDFCDPFCGSGTICIEAALIALNRAPGLDRSFDAQRWGFVPSGAWLAAAGEAMDKELHGKYDIWGGDVDPRAVAIARDNARKAGVEDVVRFEVADMRNFRREDTYGQLVTNPPYGERLGDLASSRKLAEAFGRALRENVPFWQIYVISADEDFARYFGRRPDKVRKLYNGMLRCSYFQFFKKTTVC